MQISQRLWNQCRAIPKYYFARPVRKDYYGILGVQKSATFDQIKEAYTKKAQELYPEVSTVVDSHESSIEQRFQDIAEAYAVLSNLQSRNTYDLLNRAQPDLIYSEQRIKQSEDATKTFRNAGEVASDYAKQREEFLRKEREIFNVDEFGRYRGGVPQKNKGFNRGNSLSHPGDYHRPLYHNMHQTPFEAEQNVTSENVEAFKSWSSEEKIGKEWQYLYQVATVDYEYFKFHEYRMYWRWFRNLIIFGIGLPLFIKTASQTKSRYLLQEIQETIGDGLPILGKVFDGKQVVLGTSGTLKLEPVQKHGHH